MRLSFNQRNISQLQKKGLLTQLMVVLSFFFNEILLIAYVERRKKRKHCQRKSYWHSLCSFSLFSSTKYSSTHMWKEEEEETLPEKELLTQLMFVLSRTRHGATQPSPTLMLWLPDFLHTTTQKNLEYQYHQIHFSMGMVIQYNVIHIWALETPLIQNDVFHFPKKLWYCNELRSLPSYIIKHCQRHNGPESWVLLA